MNLSPKIKKRIKVSLAPIVLLGGMYVFALLGTGAYAVGLGMVATAIYYRILWPEVWTMGVAIKGKQQNYIFVGILLIAAAGLLMAALFQLKT